MSNHICQVCDQPIDEHTLDDAQLCYFKSKLPVDVDSSDDVVEICHRQILVLRLSLSLVA